MSARTKMVRCAIYTRVSTDQGLEQDFNSLDAQCNASGSTGDANHSNCVCPRL
jgi:hypothetical protein